MSAQRAAACRSRASAPPWAVGDWSDIAGVRETLVRLGLHVRKVTVRDNTTERVLRSANCALFAVPAPSLDPGRGPRVA